MQRLAVRALLDWLSIATLGGTLLAQTTTRVSVSTLGAQGNGLSGSGSISADGRYVAFHSFATNLVAGDTNLALDVFVRDRLSGTTERVSVNSSGVQADAGSLVGPVSADGRYVAFTSLAGNLVPGDTNAKYDVFVHDRQTGTTERVSVESSGSQANGDSGGVFGPGPGASISADGRYVAFVSQASNLVPGGSNGAGGIFVRDRQAGTTERVSVDSSGVQGNSDSAHPSISADGRYVVFDSQASNLVAGDTNGTGDVFVHDRQTGATTLVSVDSSAVQSNSSSWNPSISADGRYVAFDGSATNLVTGDTNGSNDIFIHDTLTGMTVRASLASDGAQGNAHSSLPSISSDGRYVSFQSNATNLVPGDTNGTTDIFVRDLLLGATSRASINSHGFQGDDNSSWSAISSNGQFVAFQSSSTNLVTGDTNSVDDVFLIDRTCTGAVSTYCTAKPNSVGCVPVISSVGLPSQSGTDDFYVTASNVLNNKLGMMLWSLAPANNPFGGGTLCLQQPITRTPSQNSGGSMTGSDCTGTYSYHFSQSYMIQQLLSANTTVYAQYWSRDPGFAIPNNIGLTNGLRFTICP